MHPILYANEAGALISEVRSAIIATVQVEGVRGIKKLSEEKQGEPIPVVGKRISGIVASSQAGFEMWKSIRNPQLAFQGNFHVSRVTVEEPNA